MLKNEWLKKLLLFPLLVVLSVLLTGVYGALHNLAIYSFAPHYFEYTITRLIYPDLTSLKTAAVDGWIALINLSLPASVVLCACAVFTPSAKQLFRLFFQAVGLLIIASLIVEIVTFSVHDILFPELVSDNAASSDSSTEETGAVGYWELRFSQNLGFVLASFCSCIFVLFKVIQMRKAR